MSWADRLQLLLGDGPEGPHDPANPALYKHWASIELRFYWFLVKASISCGRNISIQIDHTCLEFIVRYLTPPVGDQSLQDEVRICVYSTPNGLA